MSQAQALKVGGRYKVVAADGAAVSVSSSGNDGVRHLSSGAVVVCAEHRIDATGKVRVRIASPAGWVDAERLEPAQGFETQLMNYDLFLQRYNVVRPGVHHGLDFPFSISGLREAGPDFLTSAFRATGILSAYNRVTAIVELKNLDHIGASENGLLEVTYLYDEPGLNTKLFVKFPPQGIDHKYSLLRYAYGEIEIARIARERKFPVTVAKSYFEDYSSYSGNYILITERIPFGQGAIEPAYRKGYDHNVPFIEEHYEVLARNLARLACAHKRGDLGEDIEEFFPFPAAARTFDPIIDLEERADAMIEFVGQTAPQLFNPAVTTPDFLRAWREDVIYGLRHKDELLAFLLTDIDYTGFCHINLNVDNAWFWRDESGALHAGLLDWGGVGQTSIGQAICGLLMMLSPEKHAEIVELVIATFADECAKLGFDALRKDVLHFHYKASIFSTTICIFLTVLLEHIKKIPDGFFVSLSDRNDPALMNSGLYGAIGWIDNILCEWMEDLTPGEACRSIVEGKIGVLEAVI